MGSEHYDGDLAVTDGAMTADDVEDVEDHHHQWLRLTREWEIEWEKER